MKSRSRQWPQRGTRSARGNQMKVQFFQIADRRINSSLLRFLSLFAAMLLPPSAMGQEVSAYRVGKIITMNEKDEVINNAVLIVRDGKVAQIGKASQVEIPEGAEVIEMPSCWLVPGFVELHNHSAGASTDLHDYVYLTNPDLRTLESVNPGTENFKLARAGGVTSALLISGSGTNMSGLGTVIKFAEGQMDDVVLKFPGSIKIAQAGNPERYWFRVGRSFMNYNLRQTLQAARDYHQEWLDFESGKTKQQPLFDPIYDPFRGLFRGEFIASMHTQQYQVVMMTLMLVKGQFGIRTVLDHSTFDGYKNATLVIEGQDVITINGPRQLYFDGTQRRIFGNAHRWWQGGIPKLGINTDSPVIPQEELSYQAAMACYYGWKTYEAIRGLTRIGAEALLLEDRIGSLRPGMDADFAIWSGDPIDPRSTCWIAVIDGQVVRDARGELRRF